MNKVVIDCLVQQTGELDDGTSDVNTIGNAAVQACKAPREQFLQVLALNYGNGVDLNAARAQAAQQDLQSANYIILRRRAQARRGN